jgi:hypothetical protein
MPEFRLESVDERAASSEWRSRGGYEHKNERTSRSGVPDRFYARNGKSFWVEWKRIGEPLEGQQELRIAAMRAAGLLVLGPCYTRNEFWRFVRDNAL